MLVCFDLSFESECTLLIIVYNNYDLLLRATRAMHGAIFGTLAHASFMVGSITHHTKDTVLPLQRTPHNDLSGALVTNDLTAGGHFGRRIFWKGSGISERSWEMGALAVVGRAAQVESLYSWRLSSKARFTDTCESAARHSPTPTH